METTVHVIHYTVDGEPQETTEHQLSPRQIVVNAGLNPDERYLVEIKQRGEISYQDKMDVPINMHEHQKFVTFPVGSTPVS